MKFKFFYLLLVLAALSAVIPAGEGGSGEQNPNPPSNPPSNPPGNSPNNPPNGPKDGKKDSGSGSDEHDRKKGGGSGSDEHDRKKGGGSGSGEHGGGNRPPPKCPSKPQCPNQEKNIGVVKQILQLVSNLLVAVLKALTKGLL